MLKVYLGYDPMEHEAYEIARFSLERRSSAPVLTTPIYSMNPAYNRSWHKREDGQRVDDIDGKPFSTEFSFARFLVPAFEKYQGWALFADCDFLFLEDIANLRDYMHPDFAVRVVKHRHAPGNEKIKMNGQEQTVYPRKNWSSFILWNCGHEANRQLTPEVVNTAKGSFLHQFEWLHDSQIGDLPQEWNHLVGYDEPRPATDLSAIHYTSGGPWFEKYVNCQYAHEWTNELSEYRRAKLQLIRTATGKAEHI